MQREKVQNLNFYLQRFRFSRHDVHSCCHNNSIKVINIGPCLLNCYIRLAYILIKHFFSLLPCKIMIPSCLFCFLSSASMIMREMRNKRDLDLHTNTEKKPRNKESKEWKLSLSLDTFPVGNRPDTKAKARNPPLLCIK